jgi:hypothetical protein
MKQKQQDLTITVMVWPDDSWCYASEIEESLVWKSDDYLIYELPVTMEEPPLYDEIIALKMNEKAICQEN